MAKTPNIDYFPYINAEGLISLKAMQSYVNDTVTLRCMLNFAKRLHNDSIISQQQHKSIYQEIITKSFNAPGYDLLYKPKNSREVGIVAEVKCNIPAGKNGMFGGNQKRLINDDIIRLKKALADENINKYLTFLVLLDHNGLYFKAINDVKGKHRQLVDYTKTKVLRARNKATQNNIFVVREDII